MKAKLIYIGKEDSAELTAAVAAYVGKIKFYLPFEMEAIPYLKNKVSQEEQKKLEGQLFLKKIDPADHVVLLDEHGVEMSSVQFSQFMQQQMLRGTKRLVFLIGGAYGFSEEVYKRGNSKLSLSRMTFSHQMVRTVFAEQLYRALTILKGEPYHHE